MQLIKELLRYNDSAAAAKWARRLNIAMEYLPSALQIYMISEPETGEFIIYQHCYQQYYSISFQVCHL